MKKQNFFCKTLFTLTILFISMSISIQAQRGVGVVNVTDENGKKKKVKIYDGSYALIIGNDNYTSGWKKLPGVVEDSSEVGKTLRNKGFKVTVAKNLKRQEFLNELERFISTYGLDPNNQILVYYAGHGHTEKIGKQEVGYIVMQDAPEPNKNISLFRQRSVEMTEIESLAKRIKSKHALFIFDSCFSGSLTRNSGQKPPALITSKATKPVRQFITSGTADQVVPDKSIFRVMFQRALDGQADFNNDSYVTASELGVFLEDKVASYTNNAQTPQYSKIRDISLDEGDFIFSTTNVKLKDDSISFKIPEAKPQNCRDSLSYYPLSEDALTNKKKLNLAFVEFNNAISKFKSCVEAYKGRGTILVIRGEANKALKDFTKVIQIDPQSYTAYSSRGMIYFKSEKYEKAISDLNRGIRLCKENKYCSQSLAASNRMFIVRGESYYQLKKYEKAIKDLTVVIQNFKKYDEEDEYFINRIFTFRGVAFYHLEKYKEAIADLNVRIQNCEKEKNCDNNSISDLFAIRGESYYHQELYDQAIKDLGLAINANNSSRDLYVYRGISYLSRNKDKCQPGCSNEYDNKYLEEMILAERDFDKAINIYAKSSNLFFYRGLARSNRGIMKKDVGLIRLAINDMNEAIKLEANNAVFYGTRGQLFRMIGESAKSQADLRKAESLKANN